MVLTAVIAAIVALCTWEVCVPMVGLYKSARRSVGLPEAKVAATTRVTAPVPTTAHTAPAPTATPRVGVLAAG